MPRHIEEWEARLTRLLLDAGLVGVTQPTITRKFPGKYEAVQELLERWLAADKVQRFYDAKAGSTTPTVIWRATTLMLVEDEPEEEKPQIGTVH